MKSTGMHRVRGAIVILLLLMGCAACRSRSTPAPNFILIVVDTLRADRLGSYGSDRALTPFLDELAGRSTVFQRAYAQSSWTVPSVVSLFTSSFPSQHQATTYSSLGPPASTRFAEVLHAHGYGTAAWSANTMIEGQRGFGRGFDHFEVLEPTNLPGFDGIVFSARAERVDEELVKWVAARTKQASAPTFLYVQ